MGTPVKFVITLYYHGFYLSQISMVWRILGRPGPTDNEDEERLGEGAARASGGLSSLKVSARGQLGKRPA